MRFVRLRVRKLARLPRPKADSRPNLQIHNKRYERHDDCGELVLTVPTYRLDAALLLTRRAMGARGADADVDALRFVPVPVPVLLPRGRPESALAGHARSALMTPSRLLWRTNRLSAGGAAASVNSEPYCFCRYWTILRFRELFQWFLIALSVLCAPRLVGSRGFQREHAVSIFGNGPRLRELCTTTEGDACPRDASPIDG